MYLTLLNFDDFLAHVKEGAPHDVRVRVMFNKEGMSGSTWVDATAIEQIGDTMCVVGVRQYVQTGLPPDQYLAAAKLARDMGEDWTAKLKAAGVEARPGAWED